MSERETLEERRARVELELSYNRQRALEETVIAQDTCTDCGALAGDRHYYMCGTYYRARMARQAALDHELLLQKQGSKQ